MKEFERVLLVSFPNLLPRCGARRAPGVACANQSERELAADRVVGVELAPGKRIEIEADPPAVREGASTQQLELRRIVAGRARQRNPVGWVVGQAQPKAV